MDTAQAIVLGFVQGLTEFLPVSSTAHLRIVPAFLGWDDPGAAFTAVIQLGTMAAILLYFRVEIARILVAWVRGLRNPEIRQTLDSRLGWYVLVGTIPIGIFGLAFRHQIENGARNLELIGTALIVLGLVLLYAEHVSTRSRDIDSLTMRDGVLIGVAQAFALIPGVSRSGGDDHRRPLPRPRPHGGGALLVSALHPRGRAERAARAAPCDGGQRAGRWPTIVATVVAFVVGYASIAGLLKFLTTHSTLVFVVYRVGSA